MLAVILLLLVKQVFSSTELCVCPEHSLGESENHTCHTLEEYLMGNISESFNRSDVILQFLSGSHLLNGTLAIERQSHVSLVGCGQNVSIKCTGENSGIWIDQSTEVKLANLKFFRCGTTINNDTASLIVTNGENFNLTNITIAYGVDAGILLTNISETTFISRLNIINTTPTRGQRKGNAIAYYKNKDDTSYKLVLQDSAFINNSCYYYQEKHCCEERTNIKEKCLFLSGLTIRVSGCHASIHVSRSEFRDNKGGGNLLMDMVHLPNISKENVTLRDLLIAGGDACSGGGLYIFITIGNSTANVSGPQVRAYTSQTLIENVTFTGNRACFMGAGLYTQLKASLQNTKPYTIAIKNCTFENNSLKVGRKGGIAIHNNYFDIDSYTQHFTPQYKVILHSSTFREHRVENNNKKIGGNSVMFINSHDHFEIADITITKNLVNAITAVSSNLVLKGKITLSSNNGSSGGGLLLCQGTTIYLTSDTTMSIFDNRVVHTGGGICVEPRCLIEKPRCFFQVSNEVKQKPELLGNITINIYNNSAGYGGSDVYGGDIDFCYMIDSPDKNQAPNTSLEVYHAIFNVSNETVTSPPRQICFCENKTMNCDMTNTKRHSYPGEVFSVEAVLLGQMNGTVAGVVNAWAIAGNFNFTPNVQNILNACTQLNYTISGHFGQVTLDLGVQHTGDQSGYERLKQYRRKHLHVDLKQCPIGFKLSDDATCNACTLNFANVECHVKKQVFMTRKEGANVWIGFEYTNHHTNHMPSAMKYNSNCPFDYCKKCKLKLLLDKRKHKHGQDICANSRTGVLCGACRDGYSTVLGSSRCERCSNQYLILLVPIAIAGFCLVIALTLLNLTIAEGTLSGLIFYANVIECNSSFFIPSSDHSSFPTSVLRVFIAWINLDLGIVTCFFDGMDEYTESWLQFAFPLYIWAIAIAIILLSNKFQLVAKVASRNAVKVLATLMLLSYATFIRVVISAFSYARVHTYTQVENGTTVAETVWLIDGNVRYFGFKHTLLFTVALFFGVITLPLTLALLLIRQLQRFSHRRTFRWVESLKPFLDAFTGPFTDSGRFWPGLLLLARIGLSVTGGLNTLSAHKVIQGAVSLVVVILLITAALVRPGLYPRQSLNALEYFFLLNLSVLFLGTTYYDGQSYMQKTVFDVAVGMAFTVFVAIVFYHLHLRIRQHTLGRTAVVWLRVRLEALQESLRLENRASIMRNFPPYNTFTTDRESLLSDNED
jgi:hypothetical protein